MRYLISGYNTKLPGETNNGKLMAQAFRNDKEGMLRELELYRLSKHINRIVIKGDK